MRYVLVIGLAALTIGGCATKQYGRMQPVSSYEMSTYTCRDIAIELSKVDAFDEQIRDQAGFNTASALGVLGDFGIGNSMAKGGAEKSSIARRRQLHMLGAQKNCQPTPSRIAEPSEEVTEPPAEATEPPAEVTEPPAEATEPPAEVTEPPAGG